MKAYVGLQSFHERITNRSDREDDEFGGKTEGADEEHMQKVSLANGDGYLRRYGLWNGRIPLNTAISNIF